MEEGSFVSKQEELWKKKKLKSPAKVMFLTFFTCGLYMPSWFFLTTKKLENNNVPMPSSYITFFVLFFIPVMMFLFVQYTNYVFPEYSGFLLWLVRWGWVFAIVLVVKYIFDFCIAYGEFTQTMGIAWFLGFFMGYIGVLGILFQNFYIIPLMLIFPILLAAMQAQLNFWISTANLKK